MEETGIKRSGFVCLLAISLFPVVTGHARLLDPPSRHTAWRFGFDSPPDYNDNENFCGGYMRQHNSINQGRCGICGDAADAPAPQTVAPGGKYANGIITRNYTQGSVITAVVQVTANHNGYFEFRLCPNNNVEKDPGEECFHRHILEVADGSGVRFFMPFRLHSRNRFIVEVPLKMPDGLVCEQCILQWTYVCGNNWGVCADGSGRVGCGPQETFRDCADIRITRSSQIQQTHDNMEELFFDEGPPVENALLGDAPDDGQPGSE